MKRIRFADLARRELQAEVADYNENETGLGARFLLASEEAAARELAYPLTGTPASERTRRVFLRGSHLHMSIDLMTWELSSLRWLILRAIRATSVVVWMA